MSNRVQLRLPQREITRVSYICILLIIHMEVMWVGEFFR